MAGDVAYPLLVSDVATYEAEAGTVTGVHVNAAERPDLRDLWSTLVTEPGGLVYADWGLATDGSLLIPVLGVKVERPTPCEFSVAFDYGRHRDVLEVAAADGVIHLTVDAPGPGEGADLLGLRFDAPKVAALLARLREGTS